MAFNQLQNLVRHTELRAADAVKRVALNSPGLFARLTRMPAGAGEHLSATAAQRAARHAIRTVPAYASFLAQSGWTDRAGLSVKAWMATLPVTDKAGYIKAFSTAERCVGGRIPLRGTEMDESSGSSGTPYNWVRGRDELEEVHKVLSSVAALLFGDEIITINCFSMGAWSTGTNTAAAFRRNGLVKSPGPDAVKVLDTLRFLGPNYTYVVTGYPPFLRELLEAGDAEGLDWSAFRMFGVVGGEGMSEQLRSRLERRFVKVYSAYGASDLDIGVATETPASIELRKAAAVNDALRAELFGEHSRLPMLFQYNPLDYYIETNDDHELIVTVSRMSMLSPRVRYNIHDAGGVLPYNTVRAIALRHGIDIGSGGEATFRMPFVFVAGRSDNTISFMGANIYPEDVEQGLLDDTAIAEQIKGFCMELVEIEPGIERPRIHVEIAVGDRTIGLGEHLAAMVRERLMKNSRDYRAAVAESSAASDIEVQLHNIGTGPFADSSKRLKRRYILKGTN